MDQEKFGKFIKQLRHEKNITQEALADKLFVTRQAVSKWEMGKSIPDSPLLLELSDYFEVSVNELLRGERKNSEETIEDSENITLNIVDNYNKKSRKLKKITKISVTIILSLIIIFLAYYFITSYNSIKVYKIEGEGKHFFTYNGILISTKQKSYIRLGKLKNYDNLEIERVTLYYYDKNNNKKVIYDDSETDILLTEYYGYDEYYTYSDTNYIIKNMHLLIKYKDNKKEKIKLNLTKDFSNGIFYIFMGKNQINNESKNNKLNDTYFIKKVDSTMKKHEKENNEYYYKIENKNHKLCFSYEKQILTINVEYGNSYELWRIVLKDKNSMYYQKIIGEKEQTTKNINYRNPKELSKEDKVIYNKAIKYIETYLFET